MDSRAGSSMVEHCPFKAGVLGSNPSRLTNLFVCHFPPVFTIGTECYFQKSMHFIGTHLRGVSNILIIGFGFHE